MLQVQQFLQTGTFDDLTNQLGIKVVKHESLPLVILNYDQIESPKCHPIVRECRALVLHADTHQVVGKSFDRFFNWGEVLDEAALFDFSDFAVQSKEDGSLVLLYHFDGRWRVNTRGSFAQDNMQFQSITWEQGIVQKALGVHCLEELSLDPSICYVCEFCSLWNKVVRSYPTPTLFLLTAFDRNTLRELTIDECDQIALACPNFRRPVVYRFKGIDEIQAFLEEQSAADPTFEGVVIRDRHGHRWKLKNPTYLSLHRMKGNGDNLFNPKNLLPFILSGEEAELLLYFPEVEEAYRSAKAKVDEAYENLRKVWAEHHAIEVQKDFALAIVGKTKFTGILFQLRKQCGKEQTEADLKNLWKQSADAILKMVDFQSETLPP